MRLTSTKVSRLRGRRTQESGAVALLVASMTIIMFGLAALVADLGQARLVRGEAQAASDASALAAGNALYLAGTRTPDLTGAIAAAKSYASKNYGVTQADWATCQDATALAYHAPDTACISFDSSTQPTKVRVVAPVRGVNLVFGSLFGVHDVDISAQAEASLKVGGGAKCGLCIVGHGYHDLQNGDAIISGGDVSINGDVNIQNNGLVSTDGVISVEGDATGPLSAYSPPPLKYQTPIEDPLAYVNLPTDFSSMTAKTNPCVNGPGIYGAINWPNGSCTLPPGLYVITGEWAFSGQAGVDGTAGVTLYFTCGTTTAPTPCAAPGQQGGWLDATGNGDIKLTAPSTGPYAGLAIVYDRLNTSLLRLTGNGASQYVGTIYARSAEMRYNGNSCTRAHESLIVVQSLGFDGNNSCMKSNYTLSKNVYIPASGLHLSQ